MTKQFLGLAIATVLAMHGEAHADEVFVDGAVEHAATKTCVSGSPTTLKAGYIVDPVLQEPALGQSTVMHGMAMVNANCGDSITLEFFIPAGAHFDPNRAVVCNLIKPNGVVLSFGNGPTSFCAQVNQRPVPGAFGGRAFGGFSGISFGNTIEVRVPIIFDQQMDDVPLAVAANTLIPGGILATVLATAPFQPALNPAARGDDIGLLGSSGLGLPVAFSNDDGSFTVTNHGAGDFPAWARLPGVQRLSGDFNNDGLTDFALVGGPGWQSIPVALSNGNGEFTITNSAVGNFGNLFGAASTATAVTGDFNHDGLTDIALVGGANWASIPVAFNLGNGNFNITNVAIPVFPQMATVSGARPIVGDFNHDGFADIALVGGAGMNTIPIAYSFGNGGFSITNQQASSLFCGIICNGANFPFVASFAGMQIVSGDFNKDGFTDLAVTGLFFGSPTFVVALGLGSGNFEVKVPSVGPFASMATQAGAKLLTGDFNGDGYTDLALVGANIPTLPVAMSAGYGNFNFSNMPVNQFGSWAATPGVRAVTGDFNHDGYTDIALVGGSGWQTIPVAMNLGWGLFSVTNLAATRMPEWASEPNTTAISGHVDY